MKKPDGIRDAGQEDGVPNTSLSPARRTPLPNPRPPFTMSDQEFENIGWNQYRLRKDPKVDFKKYKHPPGRALKLQMALMYEVLALKPPRDHEAEERAQQIKDLQG